MTVARVTCRTSYPPRSISIGALENKPIIDVRGVVVDRGKIFVSPVFERATELRGVHPRVAPPHQPTAKPHIERLLKTIGDDFVRWIQDTRDARSATGAETGEGYCVAAVCTPGAARRMGHHGVSEPSPLGASPDSGPSDAALSQCHVSSDVGDDATPVRTMTRDVGSR